MRTSGTKYLKVDRLPAKALPVSKFVKELGEQFNISSVSYAHLKYDRHLFGYAKPSTGEIVFRAHPGFDIVDFMGTNYVINY